MNKRPIILTIIDGLGLREQTQGNAFALANTPTFDEYFKDYPYSILQASGKFVGLPKGQMGNSEVGHLTIGAGCTVYTGLSLINKAIEDHYFDNNDSFVNCFKNIKNDETLHLMGLLSNGGVHSHETHLFELINAAHKFGLKKVAIHVFGDGRDVKPKSIISSLEKIVKLCNEYNYKIMTISGRFYAMDRDQIFDRVIKTYEVMTKCIGNTFVDPIAYINEQYEKNITDEFLIPAYNKENKNYEIKNNDSIIFFNFRPDRARELTHLFINSNVYDFKNSNPIKIKNFVSMMKYEGMNTQIAFEEMEIDEPLGKVIEEKNLKQLRIAETQKYAHVTFFFDGGHDILYKNENRILIDSIKAESFADYPQMSAEGITDALIKNMDKYDLIVMNYANPDMVGHTGNLSATIEAIEFLDKQLKRIKDKITEINAVQFITADHGNAEVTEDENNQPATKHTTNPVMLICSDKNIELKKDGALYDVAPTILEYMGIAKGHKMTGNSLILNKK